MAGKIGSAAGRASVQVSKIGKTGLWEDCGKTANPLEHHGKTTTLQEEYRMMSFILYSPCIVFLDPGY